MLHKGISDVVYTDMDTYVLAGLNTRQPTPPKLRPILRLPLGFARFPG